MYHELDISDPYININLVIGQLWITYKDKIWRHYRSIYVFISYETWSRYIVIADPVMIANPVRMTDPAKRRYLNS